ncbi:hypothetical protein PC0014_02070 [Streptococcus pneumoniae]|nr:hypothetical protein PC0014_02070 [Streptococcus pneumoniae]
MGHLLSVPDELISLFLLVLDKITQIILVLSLIWSSVLYTTRWFLHHVLYIHHNLWNDEMTDDERVDIPSHHLINYGDVGSRAP